MRNQKGFGAVEGLLFLILLSILGFTGYYVYHSRNNANSTYNNATNGSSPGSDNAYAGWKSYSDDFVSFKYPASWAPTRDDNTSLPGTKWLKVEGPDDSTVAALTDIKPQHKAGLTLNIFDSIDSGCKCKVYDILPLTIQGYSAGRLIITGDTRLGGDPSSPVRTLQVSDDSKATVGASSFKDGLSVGSKNIGIWADINVDGTTDNGVSDTNAFGKSQSVKELTKILNSLAFK